MRQEHLGREKGAHVNGSKSQQEPQGELRFSQEQYDMLLRCSQKKDIS